MRWLNKHIVIISFIWWLMQGVLLLLNEIRVYYYVDNKNGVDWFFISVSFFLIITSFLLLIKNRKFILFLSGLLLLYSIFVMYAMTVLFFMEANTRYILVAIFLCFVAPILNIFVSIVLLINKRNISDLSNQITD